MPRIPLSGILLLFVTLTALPAASQRPYPPQQPGIVPSTATADDEHRIQQQMQKGLQKKRYEDMKRDSQRLLELATELKQYVDKSGDNILSLDVLKKAEELEKLARRVKENMRGQ